jgi:hypothetical protein
MHIKLNGLLNDLLNLASEFVGDVTLRFVKTQMFVLGSLLDPQDFTTTVFHVPHLFLNSC